MVVSAIDQNSSAARISTVFTEAWEGDDSIAFASIFAADAIYRDDQAGRVCQSTEELRLFHAHFKSAIPDFKLGLTDAFQADRKLCLTWTSTGTQTGEYHGRAATNRPFAASGVSVIHLDQAGMITQCTDYYDAAALARQLQA